MTTCTHLDHIQITELPDEVQVGCCDSSPQRHASGHAREADHPIMRSLEPGEDWSWCFVDEVAMLIREVHGNTSIPPSPLG